MTPATLETKLLLPRSRARAVPRPRLDRLLTLGAEARLTLLSAPAGFGKTTLLGTWLATEGRRPTAWLSLDERDREAASFWTYVLLAIDRAAPGTTTAASTLLRAGHTPIDAVLSALLNELSVLPVDVTLVLDDYHLAEGPDVQAGMTFLLDHLPPQLHVVISSRADPGLSLARLRVRGDLVEIRAADLRFTDDEAAAYLNDLHDLGLAPADVASLEARTEGWAAALQLAALSLQGRDDPSRFIAGFAGDDRFVVDYLADEVLDREPPQVRQFLLDTSVVDRLTGDLCDGVTGSSGGAAMLSSLERQNLFLISLDAHRRWYRYHHLFADTLRARLLAERPDDVPELHRRASRWFDQVGDPEAAVRHALTAGDVELAASLAERAIPGLLRERREAIVRRWVDELPPDILSSRPVLAVGFVGALSLCNEFEGLDKRLTEVERLLASPPPDGLVLADAAELTRLPAVVATYRAALALVDGDLAGTVEQAGLALTRAAEDDLLTTASASALVGLASWTDGDLDAAQNAYCVAEDALRRAGHLADVLACTIALTDIELTQGRLGDAQARLHRALALAAPREPAQPVELGGGLTLAGWGDAPRRGSPDMLVGLARLALERGDLNGADECLRRADELGDAAGLPQNPYRWRVALALLRQAQGDPTSAIGLLEEAEQVYVGDFSPDVRPVAATRARVLAASGEVAQALAWVRRRRVTADEEVTYLREYELVTLVRVLLAHHTATGAAASLSDGTAMLDRLLVAAEAGGRIGVLIEVLVLQARARAAAGQREQALVSLQRAVHLAEPEGWVRVFTSEPAPMKQLLRALRDRRNGADFVRRLLAAMTADGPAGAAAISRSVAVGGQELVDALSDRELEVLRWLRSDLDGPAIARELGVSLATVRTHTQHIYTKLGVGNRRAAVRRAHQLNLFSRTAQR